MPPDLGPDLALALELADLADEITLERFRAADLAVETKPDMTPVSEADRAVEEVIRAQLADERPGHAIVGEEFGPKGWGGPGGEGGSWRWILDPIDGTKNYVRGIPVFATLIALEHDNEMVVGVASAPALGRRWWAARSQGAFADGQPISVSKVSSLEHAHLSYDSIGGFEDAGLAGPFLALSRRCWRTRGFGDFWSHVLVAEGSIEIAVEPEVALWDLAPLQVIVEEAGGRFSDLSGKRRADGGNALSTNGLLHDQVLAELGCR